MATPKTAAAKQSHMSNTVSSLPCTLQSEQDDVVDKVLTLHNDTAKKSAFLLDLSNNNGNGIGNDDSTDDTAAIHGPAHCIIGHKNDRSILHVGGFQLQSNAKMVEVYLAEHGTDRSTNGNDDDDDASYDYLTTCRAVPVSNLEQTYKVVCVIPGGPRAVRGMRLKLLSLQPKATTVARLMALKVTARIQEPADGSSSERTTESSTATNNAAAQNPLATAAAAPLAGPLAASNPMQSAQPPPETTSISQADIGAAMAGMSMMVRSTEERIQSTTKTQVQTLSSTLQSTLQGQAQKIQQLQQLVVSQSTILQKQQTMLQQQHELLQQQNQELRVLKEGQAQLRETLDASVTPVLESLVDIQTDLRDDVLQMARDANSATTPVQSVPGICRQETETRGSRSTDDKELQESANADVTGARTTIVDGNADAENTTNESPGRDDDAESTGGT